MSATPVRPARVIACRSFRADVDAVIETAFEETLDVLASAGLPVERVASPSDRSVVVDWFTISAAELAQSLEDVRDRWEELDDTLLATLRFGEAVPLSAYLGAVRRRHDVAARFDDLLGTDTVLVVPTLNATSWPAEGPLPTHAGTVHDDPSIATNTPDLNLTGHPGVSVPIGRDDAGVPFGLQVVAPRFADGLALGVAVLVEQQRPWPTVAPGYSPFPTG